MTHYLYCNCTFIYFTVQRGFVKKFSLIICSDSNNDMTFMEPHNLHKKRHIDKYRLEWAITVALNTITWIDVQQFLPISYLILMIYTLGLSAHGAHLSNYDSRMHVLNSI